MWLHRRNVIILVDERARCPICIVRKGSINSPWIRETSVYRYDQRRYRDSNSIRRFAWKSGGGRMKESRNRIDSSFLLRFFFSQDDADNEKSRVTNKAKNERRNVPIDPTHRHYLLCWNCAIVGRSFQSLEEDWFYNRELESVSSRECDESGKSRNLAFHKNEGIESFFKWRECGEFEEILELLEWATCTIIIGYFMYCFMLGVIVERFNWNEIWFNWNYRNFCEFFFFF